MAVENDIVLIYLEDSPVFFARVESIWPDVKKDWFNIELLVLQVPLKVIIWTLKDVYINGGEFYMDGRKMRMEVVEAPADAYEMEDPEDDDPYDDDQEQGNGAPKPLRLSRSQNHRSNAGAQTPDVRETENDENPGGQVISFADFQKRKNNQ